VLLNVGVLGSFAVMKYYPSLDFVDGVSTILIGLYIIYGASKIGYEAIQMLLDSAISPEDQQKIFDIAVREKDVINIHDLRTRQSGRIKIIQLHATMDSAMSLLRAHNAADRIEKSIREAFPDADVTVHMEPLEVPHG
jgi:ferrous-iron efflux pump FieF